MGFVAGKFFWLQYYLTDSWLKVTLYDNQTTSVSATPTGKPDEYKVVLHAQVGKGWRDGPRDIPATGMADYIDIGILETICQIVYGILPGSRHASILKSIPCLRTI
jgi:hypothetical protein